MKEIYELRLKLESPLIITTAQIGKTLYHQYDFIPATTLRGALLAELYRRGMDVSKEIQEPSFIVKNAFPVVDDEISEPAHPLVYRCKLCDALNDEESRTFVSEAIRDFRENGKINTDKLVPSRCLRGHKGTIESLGGRMIIYRKGKIKEVSLVRVTQDSIGISKVIRSSEIGMLYNYTGIAPGQEFASLIVGSKDIIDEIKKNDVIRIGRGKSRGLGKVKLELREYKPDVERINSLIHGDKILVKAMSHIMNIELKQEDGRLYSNFDLNLKVCKPVNLFKNINKILTGKGKISGFTFLKNSISPKPIFYGALPGSLYAFELINRDKETIEELARLEVEGVEPFNNVGINHFKVINHV